MKISNPKKILEYYQRGDVAEDYITKRFVDPLNSVEHEKQVIIMNKLMRELNCPKILEFAPGPARVTADLEVEKGTSIDSSSEMLKRAAQRMKQKGKKWTFIKGDILNGRLKSKYDVIFCFRFLLHFKEKERIKIYQQALSVLKPKGYFAFEALNQEVVLPLRWILGKERYFVYDKLYTKKDLIKELKTQGFRVIKLYPVLSHFWLQAVCSRPFTLLKMDQTAKKVIWYLEAFISSQPYEWVVLCQKK